MKKPKIVLFEDNFEVVNAMEKLLSVKYTLLVIMDSDKKSIKKALDFKPDVVLLDHDLGPCKPTGRGVSEMLKKQIGPERMISTTSGSFDTAYCLHKWYGKDVLSYRTYSSNSKKMEAKQLLDLIQKVLK